MSGRIAVAVGLACLLAGAHASEAVVDAPVVSVGLFKNGLCLVEREATLPGPGAYRVDCMPEPVHGTLWVHGAVPVEVRMTVREEAVPVGQALGLDLHKALAGRRVVLHLRDKERSPVSGTVLGAPEGAHEDWARDYRPQRHYYSSISRPRGQQPSRTFLVVDTDRGIALVEPHEVLYAQVQDVGEVPETRPTLVLTVGEGAPEPTAVRIRYLSKGLAWAPSYEVDISNADRLTVRQKAVVKNELEDLDGARLSLISGFPSIEFAHVTSPLSLGTTWAQFFQEINREPPSGHAATYNVALQQRAAPGRGAEAFAGIDWSATPHGQGPDMHYQDLGPTTLREGESLAVQVAAGEATYERIVEWIVPDTRRADGRHVPEHERRNDPDKYRDAAWDAVRFRNPLEFPMTTAPAMVVSDGRFHGQRMSYWTNPGEQATVHVTKALSVRTRSTEQEEEGTRELVWIGGDDYRKTTVQGTLSVTNHRDEAIRLVIRRRFSGELLEADGEPTRVLREEGAWSVNKRNELFWTVRLGRGEDLTLTYRYAVLVND